MTGILNFKVAGAEIRWAVPLPSGQPSLEDGLAWQLFSQMCSKQAKSLPFDSLARAHVVSGCCLGHLDCAEWNNTAWVWSSDWARVEIPVTARRRAWDELVGGFSATKTRGVPAWCVKRPQGLARASDGSSEHEGLKESHGEAIGVRNSQ